MSESQATREFLVTDICGHLFAFETDAVGAALAPQTVTPLPFVPAFVEGLVSVNDKVLTLIDLATLFALDLAGEARRSARSELLVLETGALPCAVRVNQILAKVSLDAAALLTVRGEDETDGDPETSASSHIATARFEFEGRNALVINPALLSDVLQGSQRPEGQPGILGKNESRNDFEAARETCLHFVCAGEHYAMALADVVEILDSAGSTPLPGSPAGVEGLVAIRDEVLLVLSMSTMLGLGESAQQSPAILVVEVDKQLYGLRIDHVTGIESYTEEQLRNIDDNAADIDAVLMTEQHLIGLLTPRKLLNAQRVEKFAPFLPARKQQASRKEQVFHDYLEIQLGEEIVGIPLDSVSSIAERAGFEAIEHSESSWVCGAVHLKNDILPVVDYGSLLRCQGYTPLEQQDSARRGAWVVVTAGDEQWAIPVAEANRISRINQDDIDPVEDSRQQFVAAIARREGRLMPILSLAPLSAPA